MGLEKESGQTEPSVLLGDLKKRYLRAHFRGDKDSAESSYSEMVDVVADQAIALPADQRLGFLTNTRNFFVNGGASPSSNLAYNDMFEFSNRLVVRVIEKLTTPENPEVPS
jgi:hypothetical protein